MKFWIRFTTPILRTAALLAVVLVLSSTGFAQRGSITAPVNPELEAESRHNLDVGRQYFKRKAWAGALGRLEEIIATNPEFTRIDEVYFIAGVCYSHRDEIELARKMLQLVIDEHSESEFVKRAREELAKLPK